MSVVKASGEQWVISSGEHRAVVVEVGGGLRRYTVAGVDVVDGYDADEICPAGAGQVLAPWPNRLRDGRYRFGDAQCQLPLTEPARHNAIHGLVSWARWRAEEVTADAVTVAIDVPPQPGYPWPVRVRTRWRVSAAGLRADHEAANLGTEPCPFGMAVHPYVVFPGVPIDDLTVKVPARSRLKVDSRQLPIGATSVVGTEFDFTTARRLGRSSLDTTFGDVIADPDGGSTVTLTTVDGREARVWADSGFRWWQIFTADPLGGERRRRAIAVEPMTCPPDALRSGRDLIVLEPGAVWRGSWTLRGPHQ